MTIKFIPANFEDAEELAELRVEAMRESLMNIGRFDPVRARMRFLDSYKPNSTQIVLADGKRIGFFVYTEDGKNISLDHLYIKPGSQSKGIGSMVINYVIEKAQIAQSSIRVGALKGSRSNSFYQRHGFLLAEQGEWDNYYVLALTNAG